ncbi:MAG: hypothetical protein HYY24_24280 [Verrucomicrobia bacterium]|nr:hypothetical protein [Verrucomicrobiota bacterium]
MKSSTFGCSAPLPLSNLSSSADAWRVMLRQFTRTSWSLGLVLAFLPIGVAGESLQRMQGRRMLRLRAPFVDEMAVMVARDQAWAPQSVAEWIVREAPLLTPEGRRSAPTKDVFPFAAALEKPFEPPAAPQTIGASFQAINLQDQFDDFSSGSIPPDTMGAIGPNHFMEVINSSVAIYDRGGTQISHVSLDSFFAATFDSVSYPRNGAFDPRVLYDRRSGRWLATTLEFGSPSGKNNHVILAVSASEDPTGGWYKYLLEVGQAKSGSTTYFSDYETLGADDNGVYIGLRIFPSSGTSFAKIAAMQKGPLLGGTASTVTVFSNITDMYSTPQPAYNFDAVGAGDRAWFVSSSHTVFGDVHYRRLTWSGGTPTLDTSSAILSTPGYGDPLNAPASGSLTAINVGDDRLQMAVIRDGALWTCRHVGLNSSGGASSADRTGCEWLELDVSTATASLTQSGRLYDSDASPRYYFYPSIAVNGQGHAAMGFSGSKGTEFVGAYYTGRLASDTAGTMGSVVQIKDGEAAYERPDGSGRNRWGDYSFTSLDPNDDMTIWTLQEYAESGSDIWGTWVAELLAPAPTLDDPAASAYRGQTGVTVALTGTGFYDPGAGFAGRLDVELTGGSPNGIANYAVTYTSPTQAQVSFDLATTAALGSRDVVLTNPDGQAVSVIGGFTVLNNTPTISDIADQTTEEGTATPALAFTVGDVETSAAALSVSGSSSDTTLVPNANIVFGGAGSSRTVTVTPAANQSGAATITVTVTDAEGDFATDTFVLTVNAAVRGRFLFYNQSKFDNNNAAANADDDGAVATDKSALLPGGTATFAHYTSYSRGLNGVMVDVGGLPGTPTVSDFEFKVGNDNTPSGWSAAPAPSSITVRAGDGTGGSARVTLLWANNAIQKQWLQVTVKATAATRLAADDVFYFGNAIGESGNSAIDASVTTADELKARANVTLNAAIDNVQDFNRDDRVSSADQLIARSNITFGSLALQLITVP